MSKPIVAVIGGGAAGMMAAVAAGRREPGCRVLFLEARDRIGKKILSTGNGRCNLTNQLLSTAYYHGTDVGFAEPVLRMMGTKEILSLFEGMGLLCRTEEGRVYPRGNQASSVLDVLRNELARLPNVRIVSSFPVERVNRQDGTFRIEGPETLTADAVVIAAGGCASPSVGSKRGGFFLLEGLGHTLTPVYPALAPLKTADPIAHALQGARFFGRVTLCRNGGVLASDQGELIFSASGLSGIPAMNVSGRLRGGAGEASVDFLAEYTPEQTERLLSDRQKTMAHLTLEDFLTGLLHKKIGQALLKRSGIDKLSRPAASLTRKERNAVAGEIKGLHLRILENTGFDHAQVAGGGALTAEFSARTMESIKIPGLFAAGEVLDVYGDCGGYNLHWAWASGYTAGENAAAKARAMA